MAIESDLQNQPGSSRMISWRIDAQVIFCKPDGSVAAPSQLVHDFVSSVFEDISEVGRMVATFAISFQRFGIYITSIV